MIRPLRIAEIERVSSERVGLQRSPDGTGRVRAGVHRHVHAAGPTDVEPELIRLHAGVLGQRLPQRSWTVAESRAPPSLSRQVVDRRADRPGEHIWINTVNTEGITPEIDTGQAGAYSKCCSDECDTVTDRDVGQANAINKRIMVYDSDTIGDCDAGQAGAIGKRTISDAGDSAGDCNSGQAGAAGERSTFDDANAASHYDAGYVRCVPT